MPATPPARALAAVPIFADLDDDILQLLEAESRVRRYPRGQILCTEGDPGEELILLEAGQVRVSRFAPSGQEIVLHDFDAPTAFGELALFDGAPRSSTVTATTAIQVRYLGRQTFIGLVEQEPRVAIALIRSMAAKVRANNERLSDVMSLDVPGRLAKWLLAHADGDGWLVFDQSQESLAHSIGTTRETVNRSLRRFERLGFIAVDGARIRLCDSGALREIAKG